MRVDRAQFKRQIPRPFCVEDFVFGNKSIRAFTVNIPSDRIREPFDSPPPINHSYSRVLGFDALLSTVSYIRH